MTVSRIARSMRNVASATARSHAITPSHTPFSHQILPACRNATNQSQQRAFATSMSELSPRYPVPSLGAYGEIFKDNGIPGVLSAEGYRIAWLDYQKHLAQKLAALVAGEPLENLEPKEIAVQCARDPALASVFNHASMLANNHMFFQSFSTSPQELERFPAIRNDLVSAFGSIENLRSSMIESAAGMFGPGFTWLVYNAGPSGSSDPRNKKSKYPHLGWRILNTYNAGTPFGHAGYRRQTIDMATNNVGTIGSHSAAGRMDAQIPPGSTRLLPVLGVSTWEHVYLYDYGVSGKRNFLDRWWKAIDWSFVDSTLGTWNATSHIAQNNVDRAQEINQLQRQQAGFHE